MGTDALVNPWLEEESRFSLDVEAFMNDIEQLPAFLVSPSRKYLEAAELIPVLRVLAEAR